MTEARIPMKEAIPMLGLPERTVRAMAACGEIPGAARYRGRWTFNLEKFKWFAERVKAGEFVARRTRTGAVPGSGIPSTRPGFIYFIQCGDFIKIGFSEADKAERRINNLRTSNPIEIVVLRVIKGSRRKEAKIHAQFASHRHRGEWFRKSPELVSFVERMN